MSECNVCEKKILPATPTIEVIGGFFDPDDIEFFVIDEGVTDRKLFHRACFIEIVTKG